jgi:hypothetical protein
VRHGALLQRKDLRWREKISGHENAHPQAIIALEKNKTLDSSRVIM